MISRLPRPASLLSTLAVPMVFVGCVCAPKSGSFETASLEEKFKKADGNGDGRVSRKEFGGLLIEEAFVLFDSNRSGYVTLEEYVKAGGTAAGFAKLDRNGNGKITLEEAKSAEVAMDAMTVSFYGADVNKDGYVTLGEALAYREKARAYTR